MNAFVKTTNGNFPNPNFYYAWKGFDELKFEVIKFEESELENPSFWISCNKGTPVFAGVSIFDKIVSKLGITYNKIDTYPEILHPFLNRSVEKTTLGVIRKQWESYPKGSKFIKPVQQKKFNGFVINSLLDWIKLSNVGDDTEVYIVDAVEFVSEFRIYIQDSEIIQGKHYRGDWTNVVNKHIINKAIKTFKPIAPCAYALDFGVLKDGRTALVEFNDATSLGNYGLYHAYYANMLISRWNEICQ